ncbi:MAG TPA: M48 family metallopeptidase [Xanthobacteraceae bacterium]|nr:M48 family metallopeptidase [Xanthobacteraceae bacterium]
MTMQDAQEVAAVYFDGASSRKHQVTLRVGAALEIVEDGAVVATWPFEAIRRADGSTVNRLRLSCAAAAPLARLEIEDPATIAAVTARSSALDVDRGGRRHVARIVFWSGAAVVSILAMVVYGLPLIADRLAPLVPYSVERRIGTAVDLQIRTLFGDKTCEAPAGKAAFRSMVEKLRVAGGIEHPLDANVLQHKVPNALALPGGKVYFFDSLLEKAESPDEVAGILAHELGHVHHRHVMRGIIHQGGTSYLAGLLLGDVIGGGAVIFATRQLLQASHSRESEQEADDFATMVMRKLGRSPVPPTQLLFRITGEQGKKLGGFTILNSHPLTEARVAAAKKNDVPNTGPEILSPEEWRALKAICKTE